MDRLLFELVILLPKYQSNQYVVPARELTGFRLKASSDKPITGSRSDPGICSFHHSRVNRLGNFVKLYSLGPQNGAGLVYLHAQWKGFLKLFLLLR